MAAGWSRRCGGGAKPPPPAEEAAPKGVEPGIGVESGATTEESGTAPPPPAAAVEAAPAATGATGVKASHGAGGACFQYSVWAAGEDATSERSTSRGNEHAAVPADVPPQGAAPHDESAGPAAAPGAAPPKGAAGPGRKEGPGPIEAAPKAEPSGPSNALVPFRGFDNDSPLESGSAATNPGPPHGGTKRSRPTRSRASENDNGACGRHGPPRRRWGRGFTTSVPGPPVALERPGLAIGRARQAATKSESPDA